MHIVAPAKAWAYRSSRPIGRRFVPRDKSITIPSIVIIVTILKTKVTSIKPKILSFAAGYINKGISGSQGPKTKMVKSIQGVRFLVPSSL